MKAVDIMKELEKYPELYNSVSNYLNKVFGIRSAEMSLMCSYVVKHYIEFILSKTETVESWDLKFEDIIYKNDIINLFKGEE